MTFNVTYKGAVMRGTGAIYQYVDGYFSGVAMAVDDDAVAHRVALTGYSVTSARGSVGYQTTSGRYIILNEGWEKIGQQAVMQYSQTQAQALVNKIIKNNERILCNNLLCARYAKYLTADQQAEVRALQSRLIVRNDALQDKQFVQSTTKKYPKGYVELAPYLEKLMDGEAVGIAPWIAIVVGVALLMGVSTAIYYMCKAFADESEQDVKFSKELTATLVSKLTPEEYEQLKAETKGIVTKARIKQALGSYWNALTIAAMAFAGYTLYNFFKNRK